MSAARCDFCAAEASYDGKTVMGPWAYMCEEHFRQHGVGLGVGKGQRLLKPGAAVVTPDGPGRLFSVGADGTAEVEFDYTYLVRYPIDKVRLR